MRFVEFRIPAAGFFIACPNHFWSKELGSQRDAARAERDDSFSTISPSNGVVTFTHFGGQPAGASKDREEENQTVRAAAVRRQISRFGSGHLYELLDPGSLVARQVVHDGDVAFREGGHETFFHPFLERGRVDRPVEGPFAPRGRKGAGRRQGSPFCNGHAERRRATFGRADSVRVCAPYSSKPRSRR